MNASPQTSIMGIVVMHLALAVTLVVGLLSVFFPRNVQRLSLRWNKTWIPGVPNPLVPWMKTEGYVIYLRAMGCIFVLVSAAMEIVVVEFMIHTK